MLFMPPLIQLLIFGYAANLDVNTAKIAWMDQDHSTASRELLSEFQGSGRFIIVAEPDSEAQMQRLLDRATVDAVVRVMPGFARDVERGRTDERAGSTGRNELEYGFDCFQLRGANHRAIFERGDGPVIAIENGCGDYGVGRARCKPAVPQIVARSRVWFNPDLKSRNYFIPGVVVNIITLVTLMLTAMAIVREKEIGTMEQLMVTPIRPMELILGKTLPFVLVGLWDMMLVVTASLLVFHIPFAGNFGLLVVCTLLFLLTSLGAGLFISTISRTQQQAMMTTGLFFQPFFMLSGFSFPIRNMPVSMQALTYINPVRYFMEIVRGIFLQGTGISTLWPQMVALAVFGVTILWLSVMRFHKQLE